MSGVRGRGRPKKVGRFTYYLAAGNPRDMLTTTYNTDTEVKRAAQKFWKSFHDYCQVYDSEGYDFIAKARQELEDLKEGNPYDMHGDSFAEAGSPETALTWETKFSWGTTARCQIWRVRKIDG